MRAAIYVRVSTKDGRQDTDNQLLQLQQFATKKKWEVYKVYKDHKSGKSADRESLQLMFKDAEQQKFRVLLFWSLDRLSREGIYGTFKLIERLNNLDVSFYALQQPFFDTKDKTIRDLLLSVWAAMAEQERHIISERTLAGLAKARKEGRYGGRREVGFDMKRAVRMKAAGESLDKISQVLGSPKGTVFNRLKKASREQL